MCEHGSKELGDALRTAASWLGLGLRRLTFRLEVGKSVWGDPIRWPSTRLVDVRGRESSAPNPIVDLVARDLQVLRNLGHGQRDA